MTHGPINIRSHCVFNIYFIRHRIASNPTSYLTPLCQIKFSAFYLWINTKLHYRLKNEAAAPAPVQALTTYICTTPLPLFTIILTSSQSRNSPLLRKPKVHHRIQQNLHLLPILCQIVYLKFILIQSFHLRLCLARGLFHLVCANENLLASLLFLIGLT